MEHIEMPLATTTYSIEPCTKQLDLTNTASFTKLQTTSANKVHLSALTQQLPTMLATGNMPNMYVVKFPDGIPHALTPLKQGGYMTMVQGESGQFVGSASLYKAGSQLALLNAFTAMSVATGQYFLTEINTKMEKIALSIDRILEFLYDDKRAELLSEITFVKYANNNFCTIMSSEAQCIATISSLQNAKKVAIKDMEFYLSDLEKKKNFVDKSYSKFTDNCYDAIRITDCLDLSSQLYASSCIMEAYFSQSADLAYLEYVSSEADYYLQKCDKAKLACFSSLSTKNQPQFFNSLPTKKHDTSIMDETLNSILSPLTERNHHPLSELVAKSLKQINEKTELYITADGEMYSRV